jgi:hypothetical protein
MIQSLLHLRTEVSNALKQTGHYSMCLGEYDWEVLNELKNFLHSFASMTDLVSTRITSLSLIVLIRAEIKDACALKTTDSDELKKLKKLVAKNLDKRLPITDTVNLSTLFDPATKSMVSLNDGEKEELMFSAVTKINTSEAVPLSADLAGSSQGASSNSSDLSIPLSKKMKLVMKHTPRQETADCRVREDIRNYLRYVPGESDDDPLQFWKRGLFPSLEDSARKYLTRSASSVPVENLFSTMGLMLNGKRSTMAPLRANWLSFIHDNFELYYDLVNKNDSQ